MQEILLYPKARVTRSYFTATNSEIIVDEAMRQLVLFRLGTVDFIDSFRPDTGAVFREPVFSKIKARILRDQIEYRTVSDLGLRHPRVVNAFIEGERNEL